MRSLSCYRLFFSSAKLYEHQPVRQVGEQSRHLGSAAASSGRLGWGAFFRSSLKLYEHFFDRQSLISVAVSSPMKHFENSALTSFEKLAGFSSKVKN